MISKNLVDLVDLALTDAVLTQKEREVLVNAAAKEGISEQEINLYINNQLDKRLKQKSKADLKACPHCGAQIPLLAECCPYCHYEYQEYHSRRSLDEIESYDANLIRAENAKTYNERENIGNCPNCGHPYPLISNICPACSHVLHYGDENKKNIERLTGKIFIRINELNLLPKVSIFHIIKYRHPEYCFVALATCTIALALNPNFGEYGTVPVLDLILLMMGLFFFAPAFIFPFNQEKAAHFGFAYPFTRGESPIGIRNKAVAQCKADLQSLENQIDTIYGADKECKAMLENLKKQSNKALANSRTKTMGIVFKNLLILGLMALLTVSALSSSEVRLDHLANFKFDSELESVMTRSKSLAAVEIEGNQLGRLNEYGQVDQPASIEPILMSDNQVQYRVENVLIKASGNKLTGNTDSTGLALMLLDKSYNRIGDSFFLICDNDQDVMQMMKSGKGEAYATFTTKGFNRIMMNDLEEGISNAKYYMILDFSKKHE